MRAGTPIIVALALCGLSCGRDFNLPEPPGDDGPDLDPPVFSAWTLSPEIARPGTEVILGFASDEPLPADARPGDNPEVSLGGVVFGLAGCTSPDPRSHACSLVVPPGTPDGEVTFTVVGADAEGNQTTPIQAPLTLQVDSNAP